MRTANVFIILSVLFYIIPSYSETKEKRYYGIGFYNLENLFDTIHDKGKNDYEFLPKGTHKWNSEKYTNKINNIASVLSDLGSDMLQNGVAITGVCEVENKNVLNDLIKSKALINKNWKYIHIESEDSRGIDCALLYDPKQFIPKEYKLIPFTFTNETNINKHKTRGFLVINGILANEQIHIIVNHWPSRYSKSTVREQAGKKVSILKDSITTRHPETTIIIMGDLNDNPDNISVKECLNAKRKTGEIKKKHELYNPWWDILRNEKRGSIKYKEKWNLYDQIIISGNLINNNNRKLKYIKSDIHIRQHLMNKTGKYKNYPKRTYSNDKWTNGYSDHLPVIIYLGK